MSCLGPHSLSVIESELEPSTGDSEASALFATLPLEPGCPPLLKLNFTLGIIPLPPGW